MKFKYNKIMLACLLPASLMLSGCLHDDDENKAASAMATADASASETSTVSLMGTGGGDGSLTYSWTQKSGALAVIDNADMATASFIAPVLDLTNNTESLVFELMVTDEDGDTDTAEVEVMIDLDTTISKYKVDVYNITNGQPLTPAAALLHGTAFNPWAVGSVASLGLEILAESGSPREFLTESVNDNAGVVSAGTTAGAPIGPGAMKSVVVGGVASANYQITMASMLANTNDAFAGVPKWSVGSMAVGDSMSALAHVHDAGTENNTESAGTIAGPADTSTAADKGFSATRDDPSAFVSIHSGVVTMDDGLSTSVLNESHRWGGEGAKIMVTRIQ